MTYRTGAYVFRKVSEQQLSDLWWSDQTMGEITKMLGCSDTAIRDAWRTLKDAGMIPDMPRNKKNPNELAAAELAREDHNSPSFNEMRPAEIRRDRLLEKLIEVHGSPK